MKKTAALLIQLVNDSGVIMKSVSDENFNFKPSADKWSKKEILGHLVDSAFNNHRRFVSGQTQQVPQIVYEQDEWVKLQAYQSVPKNGLIHLWWLLNIHIAHVMEMMPEENYKRECDCGKEVPEMHTLEWLAEDYLTHMRHHLRQILA
jgi:hypothetical protein